MNPKKILLSVALAGGLLLAPVIATASVIPPTTGQDAALAAPKLVAVVAPSLLPRAYLGKTVTVSLLVDESGQPHDIQVLKNHNVQLQRSMAQAVAQWRFAPAHRNGQPVSMKVELPVELAASNY